MVVRVPEIIAHRGTPRVHPENSLPGFAHALAVGADAFELDVHLTGDGVPVVHHNPALGAGPLAGTAIVDVTLAELESHLLAPGVGVPTLAEVRDLAAGRATLYVEIKAHGAEAAVARVLAGLGPAAPVHSFDHRISRQFRELEPATPVGVLSTSYLVDTVGAMQAAGARDLWQHWSMIDASLIDEVHAAGGRVVVWTVNDIDVARALARLGVDALCTDLPADIAAALAPERRAPHAPGVPRASA
jgi:glycerophosphoryl diester phosphodiesterase